jgi:hypothetical protein
MATATIYTHAFDFYYKWIATSSAANLSATWSQHSNFSLTGENVDFLDSWYNFNSSLPIMTRHTASYTTTDAALPWASAATDMLWNVLNPSSSTSQSIGTSAIARTYYRFAYTSSGFLHKEFGYGTVNYPVTSSWIAYEPKMIRHASGSGTNVGFITRGTSMGIYFPARVESSSHTYSLPTAFNPPTSTYPNVGQNPNMLTYGATSTGSGDGRFFDLAGGCGITRTSISASFVAFNVSASFSTTPARNFCTAQLKNRRLFFPTVSTGSVSLPYNAPGIWVQTFYGKPSNQFFTENGGIYNVKFNLKRDVTNGYYPDAGEESQLLVYIHNVNTTIPSPTGRIPGAPGWYPPDNNIIRIKNNPAMSFVNPATGYLIESFNVNVVQYGTPAQLVFEASGSLSSNKYFGCIIDDVEFCKIGVSTDPALIKPSTPGQFIEALQDQR